MRTRYKTHNKGHEHAYFLTRIYPLQSGEAGVCGTAGALAVFESRAVVEWGSVEDRTDRLDQGQ